MKIRKAIIPVAGLGTRFLPATKSIAKEMLPIVDKPCIQFIIEEAVASGIKEIVLITSKGKKALEDHFDVAFELEYRLEKRRKIKELSELQKIEKMAKFYFVRQDRPLGDGHAILMAKEFVRDEPFAVLFGDDVYDGKTPALKQLINQYEKIKAPVIALQKVTKEETNKYGIIKGKSSKKGAKQGLYKIENLVEKPDPEKAPSNMAVTGKYIVTPGLMKTLEKIENSHNAQKELRLIDAMRKFVKKNPIYGYEIEGNRFDTGSKFGLLQAGIHYGLKHPEIKGDLRKYLKTL